MAIPDFLRPMIVRLLRQDSVRLPSVVQSQLTAWLQQSALEKYGLRMVVKPGEIFARRRPDGKMAAHLDVQAVLSKQDLARLAERAIYEQTGVRVTVRPGDLSITDRTPSVTDATLSADVIFDPEDILKKL